MSLTNRRICIAAVFEILAAFRNVASSRDPSRSALRCIFAVHYMHQLVESNNLLWLDVAADQCD